MDTTAFIVTNVAWLLLAGVAAFRTLRYERRRQTLIVAVIEAIPPGGAGGGAAARRHPSDRHHDGAPSKLRSHLKLLRFGPHGLVQFK
jgi:hypothetical protein